MSGPSPICWRGPEIPSRNQVHSGYSTHRLDRMRFLKQFLVLLVGVAIGVAIARPSGVKAQDAKDPSHHETGLVKVTQITPQDKMMLAPGERYLGFSCVQARCYLVTMQ